MLTGLVIIMAVLMALEVAANPAEAVGADAGCRARSLAWRLRMRQR
jgi:hypothetical protein